MSTLETIEGTILYGRALGLHPDESREVVDAWVLWTQQTPNPIDWSEIRMAQQRRSDGKSWDPRTMRMSMWLEAHDDVFLDPQRETVDRINNRLARSGWTR